MSPVGYFANGPGGDHDGNLFEELGLQGGAEMSDTEEESNFCQERRKYVVFIEITTYNFQTIQGQCAIFKVPMM